MTLRRLTLFTLCLLLVCCSGKYGASKIFYRRGAMDSELIESSIMQVLERHGYVQRRGKWRKGDDVIEFRIRTTRGGVNETPLTEITVEYDYRTASSKAAVTQRKREIEGLHQEISNAVPES